MKTTKTVRTRTTTTTTTMPALVGIMTTAIRAGSREGH
jgi:hypothetical protein